MSSSILEPPATVVSCLARAARDRATRPALWTKRDGRFQASTWGQLADEVFHAAAALARQDVAAGDRVVVASENRREWIVADLALQALGAVSVPAHGSLSAQQLLRQIDLSDARLALVANQTQADKLARCVARDTAPPTFLAFDAHVAIAGQPVSTWQSLLDDPSLAAEAAQLRRSLDDRLAPDRLATILFTSGTTGESKGVMLSHGNLAANTHAVVAAFASNADELRLNLLPLSHIYARTCDLYSWLLRGSRLALAESRDTFLADCQAVRPTVINAVPYFYLRLHRNLVEQRRADAPDAVRNALGGELRQLCCGGAALPLETFDYYASQGMPVLEGYGLTEASPVITVSTEQQHRRGAVGRPLAGVEVAIAADGEVLTRGPHVMQGYWKDPAATADVVRDGWLHTGDLGRLDDGYLFLTGRKKEIIVTAGGKNIAPAAIEQRLLADPLIAQCVVIGEGRNYLTALIVPQPETLRAELRRRWIFPLSRRHALRHRRVRALYEETIRRRLADLSSYEQVRKFHLVDRAFSMDTGEMTPKLSLCREVIARHFAAEIAAMYGS